jgi:quinol monooxygenase YgiN
MSFTYSSVATRTSGSTQWFKDANPSSYNTIKSFIQTQPGYLSGAWRENPSNPNQFLVDHTWTNKASWEAASAGFQQLPAAIEYDTYVKAKIAQNVLNIAKTISE